MRIKVCGITRREDAELAAELGVDALGFNFYRESPRYVDPAAAHSIIRGLPPFVTPVGIFVNVNDPVGVEETARRAGVQVLQLHGDESPEYCRRLREWTLIKAVRLGDGPPSPGFLEYPVQALLLDTGHVRLFGGTGRTFDWNIARRFAGRLPIILAGGLKPENVASAIRLARPYGVDVCSGIENGPGRKDPDRLTAFVREVRNAIKE